MVIVVQKGKHNSRSWPEMDKKNGEVALIRWMVVVLRTLQGKLIALVSEYKYLGIIIDDKLCFDSYMNYLWLKLKQQLGFYFRN